MTLHCRCSRQPGERQQMAAKRPWPCHPCPTAETQYRQSLRHAATTLLGSFRSRISVALMTTVQVDQWVQKLSGAPHYMARPALTPRQAWFRKCRSSASSMCT